MALKTKKRYNRKKTHKQHKHKRRFRTKKQCHRGGGGPEDSYVDFIDADHSGGINVRYNESDPDKMWLIGPSSRPWTFGILSKGGKLGKNGRYIPFINAWKQDAAAQHTSITPADFLYPKRDVDSSYGMVISDAQFQRIFIEGALSILYTGLGAKYTKLKMAADQHDAVLVESNGPSVRNYSLNPFITPTPDGPFEKKSLASFFAPGPAPTHVPSTSVPSTPVPSTPQPSTLVPSMPLDVSSDDATALVRASLAEIRAIRQDKDNQSQFRNLKNFDDKLRMLGDKMLQIFGAPGCSNYHGFEAKLYDPSNDRNDPLAFKVFSDSNTKSEYTKFLDGQKSLLMLWANKSLECTSESPQSNRFIGTTFDIRESREQFKSSFQKFAKRALRLRVDTNTLRIRDNYTIIEVADDGWCFYRAGLVAMRTPAGSGQDATAIRMLREFASAISWIIVNVCPEPPDALKVFGADMDDPIVNYPVNASAMNLTAFELVKLIAVPKLSDIFKPCLYPVLSYNIGQIAAMMFGKNIFILNDSLTACEEQYCGTDSIAPERQIFMRNTNRNHFDVIQLSARVGPIVTVVAVDES